LTISSETRKAGPYLGNGLTTSFSFAFKVFTAADVLVIRTDLSAIESTLTLNTDYTVTLNSNQDSNPGGTVTLPTALTTGFLLTLSSQVGALQATDLTNQGGFYPSVINTALDKLTILIQQLKEQVGRAVKVDISSSITPSTLTSYIVALYNNLANIITVSGNTTNITSVAGNATNINSVNANATNINSVAANITNVASVGANIANVNSVAGNATNINAAVANATNINAAQGAATAASTSATNAANSATAAAGSASAASTSATSATNSATAAAGSASAAANSATAAAGSASAASTSATNAANASRLTIGTVSTGAVAAAITGPAGAQLLNLTIPPGANGINGTNGINAYTTTTASFTMPASGSSVSVSVGNTSWMSVGLPIYISTAGYFSVSSITNSTTVVLTNLGIATNASNGTVIATSSMVSPSGAQGANGSAGSPYAVSAYRTASYTISGGNGFSLVPFDGVEYDAKSCFNTTTSKYTAQIAGIHKVNARIDFADGDPIPNGTRIWASLFKNGSEYRRLPVSMGVNSLSTQVIDSLGGSCDAVLAAGDYLQLYVWSTSAISMVHPDGLATTYFQVSYAGANA
jgi:hypothetical protein